MSPVQATRTGRWRVDVPGKTWATVEDLAKCHECAQGKERGKPALCKVCWLEAFARWHPERAKELLARLNGEEPPEPQRPAEEAAPFGLVEDEEDIEDAMEIPSCNRCGKPAGATGYQEPDGTVWCQRCWNTREAG
jgi:hypothetical protein